MKYRAVEHIEHVRAHDCGVFAIVRKSHHAQNCFWLHNHVVIKQKHIIAAVLDCFEHTARETTGTTQVPLVNDAELTGKGLNDLLEFFVILHLRTALINN